MTNKDKEDFKNSTKCWICNNDYIDDLKVRDHCHNIKALHIGNVISILN